ncbi:hypothetical protein LJR225_004509 [Phenylobacterium sp. LjRoot225]|uniref:hypothetical protein n=1 Tax=Phenylobacterium sp. LjRoot225 TaxID=3342285 RepID=UPI003ECDBB97
MAAAGAKIFLATPCYGGMASIHYITSLLDLQAACRERNIGLHVELGGGDALISRARSAMAAKFLASDATHLFFVDADIGFAPEHVFRLLAADREVAGGIYPIKGIDWAKVRTAVETGKADLLAASVGYVVRFIPSPDNSVEVDEAGFGPVSYVGTGFMMLSRSAVQQVVDAHPELYARLGDVAGAGVTEAVMIFECMIEPDTRQHLSEDYAFCRRWRDLGGEIFADFQGRLTHVGAMAFSGSLLDAVRT